MFLMSNAWRCRSPWQLLTSHWHNVRHPARCSSRTSQFCHQPITVNDRQLLTNRQAVNRPTKTLMKKVIRNLITDDTDVHFRLIGLISETLKTVEC